MIYSLGNKIYSKKNPHIVGSVPVNKPNRSSYYIDILNQISPPEPQETISVQNNPNLYNKIVPNKKSRNVFTYGTAYEKQPLCEPPSSGSPSISSYASFVFNESSKTWTKVV